MIFKDVEASKMNVETNFLLTTLSTLTAMKAAAAAVIIVIPKV